jgi:hypothetical protein
VPYEDKCEEMLIFPRVGVEQAHYLKASWEIWIPVMKIKESRRSD